MQKSVEVYIQEVMKELQKAAKMRRSALQVMQSKAGASVPRSAGAGAVLGAGCWVLGAGCWVLVLVLKPRAKGWG